MIGDSLIVPFNA